MGEARLPLVERNPSWLLRKEASLESHGCRGARGICRCPAADAGGKPKSSVTSGHGVGTSVECGPAFPGAGKPGSENSEGAPSRGGVCSRVPGLAPFEGASSKFQDEFGPDLLVSDRTPLLGFRRKLVAVAGFDRHVFAGFHDAFQLQVLVRLERVDEGFLV